MLNNIGKFTGKNKVYQKYRPDYAPNALRYLQEKLGIGPGAAVADIGSGTGIFTRQLLLLGAEVFAVEPNPDMRAEAESLLAAFPGFHSIAGRDSNTTLPDQSVNLVTAAQAFHWFDPKAFRLECRRILKPGGKVLLVWNQRDPTSPVNQDSRAVFAEYCPDFIGFSGGISQRDKRIDEFFPHGYELLSFEHPIYYTREGYIGRCLSASYAILPDNPRYEQFVAALGRVFDAHEQNGRLLLSNTTVFNLGSLE
ncbi:MAG: class I SAM-dependent methyltransferase [Chloroflexi bacterium]|nr:class I SAM-dependent methyltransferase [Anaerolineaceae bacterium]NLI44756.1 class I SAM-dependent methyltransferase [Chloroflexota bacterium]HOE35211.1 class I SAM-dependent methyltransferase [Anaerolineaceae bacterium]HQL28515.1 class I SAM-dependent methyltransferase [Anaerolineaceae bacterium]